jgi:hypothetical protein
MSHTNSVLLHQDSFIIKPTYNIGRDIKFSMDGKGRAIDNIFIARFCRSIKYEKIYIEPS